MLMGVSIENIHADIATKPLQMPNIWEYMLGIDTNKSWVPKISNVVFVKAVLNLENPWIDTNPLVIRYFFKESKAF